ncbi:hypothetical protein [Acetobacter cibinongensis]|uniref:Uncharacterized protein n=1 Tax=Acetobacter cibinongensis TaxID=146475 RepID=A0A1Z5YRX5_9PROT|nr:hypothetical protein [Acetobacter cibinongensis]OUJ00062.1 hypothetical protein HK14_12530 [Acetobacter cibinongensis]
MNNDKSTVKAQPVSVLDDPRVTKNADGSLTVALEYPTQIFKDEDPITSVTLNRLRGRGMASAMDETGHGSQAAQMVLASSGMIGPKGDAFLEAVDASDFLFLAEVVTIFLKSGRKTGQ